MKYHQKGGDDSWAGFLCCKMTHTRSNPLFQDNRHYVWVLHDTFKSSGQIMAPQWYIISTVLGDLNPHHSLLISLWVIHFCYPSSFQAQIPQKNMTNMESSSFARWIPQIFPFFHPFLIPTAARGRSTEKNVPGRSRRPKAWPKSKVVPAERCWWSWKRKSWDSINCGKSMKILDHWYFITFYWIFSVSHNIIFSQPRSASNASEEFQGLPHASVPCQAPQGAAQPVVVIFLEHIRMGFLGWLTEQEHYRFIAHSMGTEGNGWNLG